MVEVTEENCIGCIEVAHVVSAARLLEEALRVASLSLHRPEVEAAARALVEAHPPLADKLLGLLLAASAERNQASCPVGGSPAWFVTA